MTTDYRVLAEHYERCFERHGDSPQGVDWPKEEDAATRYRVMLEQVRDSSPATILDFGCGLAHLLDYLEGGQFSHLDYAGLDVSERFVEACRKKHPEVEFLQLDVLEEGVQLPSFDYIVMNGVFTEKRELSFDAMWSFAQAMLRAVWPAAKRGLAFNVMSKQVDWERDDLFHLPLDLLSAFLCAEVTRDFVIRNDYGLYEYTVYLRRSGAAMGVTDG